MTTRTRTIAVLAAALLALVTACGGGEHAAPAGNAIKVWTLENLPDRVEAQKALAARFTAGHRHHGRARRRRRGPVPASSSPRRRRRTTCPTWSARCRWPACARWPANELLDTDVAGQVVDDLGADTFSAARARADRATATRSSRCPPTAGRSCWSTARTCSTAAGLPAPRTYDTICAAAAKALNTDGVAGVRRRHRARRRLHPADLREPRAGQRLRARRRRGQGHARQRRSASGASPSTATWSAPPRCRARRTSTPPGPPTSPARPP